MRRAPSTALSICALAALAVACDPPLDDAPAPPIDDGPVAPRVCEPEAAPRFPAAAQRDVLPIDPLDPVALDCRALAGDPPPAAVGPWPDSIDMPGACGHGGGEHSNYTTPGWLDDGADRPYELHVIGVYEAEPEGAPIPVVVHPTLRPIVLVLTSYEGVTWQLDPQPGSRIAAVYASGYDQPQVLGSPVAPRVLPRDSFCATGYGWEVEDNAGGGDHPAMMSAIRARFGHRESSYQGCYDGAAFSVPYAACPPLATPPQPKGDEGVDPREVPIDGCEAVLAQDLVCLAAGWGGLRMIGLDTGESCLIDPEPVDSRSPSLVWRGELAHHCGEAGLTTFILPDGDHDVPNVPCQAILEHRDTLLAQRTRRPDAWGDPSFYRFADGLALIEGDFDEQLALGLRGVSRLAIANDILYGAWHSTDHVERYDLAADVALPAIPLQGHDDWIFGFDVTDDGKMILQVREGLKVFDAATGDFLALLEIDDVGSSGLACIGR